MFRGRLHPVDARGVVQVDGHPAGQGRGQIHQGRGDGGRQQDPHPFLPGPFRFERPGQGHGSGQGLDADQTGPALVGIGQRQRADPGLVDEGPVQRTNALLTTGPRGTGQLLDGLANRSHVGSRRQRRTEGQRDLVGGLPRDLENEPVSLVAEDAAPEPVQVDGDDGRLPVPHDPLQTPVEGQQGSGSGDLTLGKDTDQFTLIQAFSGVPQRSQNLSRTLGGGDGNTPQ